MSKHIALCSQMRGDMYDIHSITFGFCINLIVKKNYPLACTSISWDILLNSLPTKPSWYRGVSDVFITTYGSKYCFHFIWKKKIGILVFFFFLDSGPEKSVLGYEKIKANKIYLTYYVRITCILPFVEVRWPMSWF